MDLWEGTTEPDRSELDEQLLEATRLTEEGESAQALAMLLSLEIDHPDDATLLCMIGALAAHLEAEGMAADFFRRCLEQNPTEPNLLVTAGAGLAAVSDPAAEPALRLATLTAPDLAAARLHYGGYLVREGLVSQGLDELAIARRLDPDDSLVRRELGVGLLLAGRAAEALEELEAAVLMEGEDLDLRMLFGLTLVQEGDLPRAAEELYPLGTLYPDDGEVQAVLALVFWVADWEDEAWLALSRAESAPEQPDRALLREVEEAIEAGGDVVRSLLLDEVAPSALRDRIYRS